MFYSNACIYMFYGIQGQHRTGKDLWTWLNKVDKLISVTDLEHPAFSKFIQQLK